MRRAGTLLIVTSALAAIAPASAGATETRRLKIDAPAARECAAELEPAGTGGIARERWTAPATGYLAVRLGGGPYAPDWDLAARSDGRTYASSHSGSAELVTLWVRAGDRVAVQACRLAGADRSVPLTIDLIETPLPRPSGERFSLESVAIDGQRDVRRLEGLGFDVTHEVTSTDATVAFYSDAERRRLRANGFRAETLIRDLAAGDRAHLRRAASRQARSALPSGRDGYRVYEDYTGEMKALAAQYPGHVRSITIGTSLEGRAIEGVELASEVNRTDDGRPVYIQAGLHHAREWPSGEFPMEFAIDLAQGFGTDPRITALLRDVRVVVLPVMNPDGFVASRSHGTSPADDDASATVPLSATDAAAYKRKNCRPTVPEQANLPCASRVGSGVDLNRNYGAYYGGPGASTDPTSQGFRGAGPFSEPESQAFLALSESVHPTVVISNHTFWDEGIWLRQPGFDAAFLPQDDQGALTPDELAMAELGDAMAAASSPAWDSDRAYVIGDITGATEDWNYYAQGAFGYTPEARGSNFHADFATMVAAEYVGDPANRADGVREAFLIAGEEAASTANHGVIAGAAPAGAQLRIEKAFSIPTCEDAVCAKGDGPAVDYAIETELAVPASGQYSWHVNPSSRPDIDPGPGRTPPAEAWTMTCKQPGQARSPAQQVLIARGQQMAVDWTGLCGPEGGGPAPELPTCGEARITVIGTGGDDTIIGTGKADVIAAGDGDDTVRGGRGRDVICGGSGADTLKGGKSADMLFGQKGGDRLSGAAGGDILRGAAGNDRLSGGKGRDKCVGGSGRDERRGCET